MPDIPHYCFTFYPVFWLETTRFKTISVLSLLKCLSALACSTRATSTGRGGTILPFYGVDTNVLDIVHSDVYDTYISAVGTVPVFHYTKRFIVTRKVGTYMVPKPQIHSGLLLAIQKFNISYRGRSPSVSIKICTHLIWDWSQNLVNDSPLSPTEQQAPSV